MEADVNKRQATYPLLTDVQKRYLWTTEDLLKNNQYHALEQQEELSFTIHSKN